jgi:hypothetical protein
VSVFHFFFIPLKDNAFVPLPHRQLNYSKTSHCYPIFGNAPTTSRQGTLRFYKNQSQSTNKAPTRLDVYTKGNRNDIFATRGADIAILTGFGEHLFTKAHGFISNN